MGLDLLKPFVTERLGKPLDEKLRGNNAYGESRKKYHIQIELLKKYLAGSRDGVQLLLELDEIVGEYSGAYGESAYVLGFHDGMEIGLEHRKQYGGESSLKVTGMEESSG